MNKRDFLTGAGIMTAATLANAIPASEAKAPGALNVRDFGAKGDGKTSDTAAIQAALDAAGKTEGTVYFPSGVYLCSDLKVRPYTTLLSEPQWIYSGEKRGAVLQLDSENASCLLDITRAYAARIRGLTLCGIRNAEKRIHGIYLNNEKFSPKEDTVVIDDVKVQKFSGHGIFLQRVWLFIIRHSIFYSNAGCGAMLIGWDGFVADNQFSGNASHGFACAGVGSTVMFTANRVEWNRQYGLYIPKGNTWNITGNSFDRNFGAGLKLENVDSITVTGNVFRRCGKDSGQLAEGETSAQVIFDGSKGICVSGNAFKAGRDDGGKGKYTPQVGFILKNLSHSVISNNTLYRGYMNEMKLDLGGHGRDFIFSNNVGCPFGG